MLWSEREKELSLRNLIVDEEFRKEFDVYRKEAVELAGQPENSSLLSPRLEEAAIVSMLTVIGNLQAEVRMDTETFQECLRLLNKTTEQFITELDYAAEAVKDEANAKIKALEELINPKIAALNTQYKRRIADLTTSFNRELENLGKQKAKNETSIESGESKIRVYQREAEAQASKNHSIYEKRWREKTAQAKKELNGLKKDLKRAEKNIKNLIKQKEAQTGKLKTELETEIKHAKQPIVDLEKTRDAKMLVFKRETEKLLRLEKPLVDGLSGAIKLGEAVSAKFALLGFADQQLKTSAQFYVPFYVACYQSGFSKRFMYLPPLTSNTIDFVAKLKGAFGASKIKQVLTPRFKSISVLINRLQELAKQESFLESQIMDLGEKNNSLIRQLSRGNIAEGLLRLRSEGWLSDKEYQIVSDSLA